nr:DUF6131 family protein [Nocardia arizonensis]
MRARHRPGALRSIHRSRELGSREVVMIIIGLILLILGFIFNIPILWTIGIIALVIGLVLLLLGSTGRAVGGRRHYY